MDDLEGDQFVIVGRAAGDEEERGVAAIDDFGICSIRRVNTIMGLWDGTCDAARRVGRATLLTFVLEEIAHPGPSGEH